MAVESVASWHRDGARQPRTNTSLEVCNIDKDGIVVVVAENVCMMYNVKSTYLRRSIFMTAGVMIQQS